MLHTSLLGTRRAYRSAWVAFEAWCASLGREPLAGDPETLAMYASRLDSPEASAIGRCEQRGSIPTRMTFRAAPVSHVAGFGQK